MNQAKKTLNVGYLEQQAAAVRESLSGSHQSALFDQLNLSQIDSRFVVRSNRPFVGFPCTRQITPFAIQIAVSLKRLAQLADHFEKLAAGER